MLRCLGLLRRAEAATEKQLRYRVSVGVVLGVCKQHLAKVVEKAMLPTPSPRIPSVLYAPSPTSAQLSGEMALPNYLYKESRNFSDNYTMPNYKLTYFNMRGRAEIIRYIFAYSDIKYEDHRIEQADWPEIKPTLPFGKIPVLEVDGLNLHQSLAIARYLTKNTDLAGKTELEQCQVDAIVDTLDDFMSCFPWAEKKQDIKEKMFNELLTFDAPHLLQDLDTYLGEKEWFIGNSVTWADFYWEICSTTLLVFKPDLLDIHPRLVTLRKKVQAIPAIADWIQRRPQTKL
ncbi:Glutathione-requiring prostaglandin D synthase [Pteropus alecto]|uniref:Hematopoietic prostaglandin D synthase n=2 Tax=Pteropus alecto TaxID=9402 RepID=L5KRW7_PTEAL|nr:Glutathione-requiring prostaglandin D synthase [Pteropus alecto]